MKDEEVVLADTGKGLGWAIQEAFGRLGGGKALLKASRDVYLKVNMVDCKKDCYTDPQVVKETILYFMNNGARDVYVIENCTQGNFTRLVFEATGLKKICRETGAVPIYLDETGVVPVFLETLGSFIDISDIVYERLLRNKEENLYVSIPKLKTHSMTQVTLSIKNQFGLVHQKSRIADHNFKLHMKIANIYKIIRPDIVLIDAQYATNYGHYVAEKNKDKCIVPMNLMIAGKDPLAVDVVGAKLMGLDVDDIEHLKRSRSFGLGQGDIRRINIINEELFDERKQELTFELLDDFPPDLEIIRGEVMACREGCRRNTEAVVEVLYGDFNGRGDFTIVMGRGVNPERIDHIQGRVHIAGSCAISECGSIITERVGRKNVTVSYGCNNLAETIHGLCKQMRVSPLKLVPMGPVSSVISLIVARLRGTKANITKLF